MHCFFCFGEGKLIYAQLSYKRVDNTYTSYKIYQKIARIIIAMCHCVPYDIPV